jgi:hypothetical protein
MIDYSVASTFSVPDWRTAMGPLPGLKTAVMPLIQINVSELSLINYTCHQFL